MMAFTLAMGGVIGPGELGVIIEQMGFSMGYLWATSFTLATQILIHIVTREERQVENTFLQSVNG